MFSTMTKTICNKDVLVCRITIDYFFLILTQNIQIPWSLIPSVLSFLYSKTNVFGVILESVCLSVCPSLCPSLCLCVHVSVCVQKTGFCQRAGCFIKPLPNNTLLRRVQILKHVQMKKQIWVKKKIVLGRVKNIVGIGENACYQHFLLFPQCFQNATILGSLKVGIVVKG